ncbi:MAG: cytochrome c3 family protein [Thermodesulfobacteriota bacterium]
MKRKFPRSLFTAAVLLFGLNTSSLAADIPETIDINLQASNPALSATSKDSKKVPGFSHAKHASTFIKNNRAHAGITNADQSTCVACHAGANSVEDIQSESTKQRQAKKVEEAGGVKKYMHALCLKCHKSMKKAKVATGPTSCKGCHKPS